MASYQYNVNVKQVTQTYLWTIESFQVDQNVHIAKSPVFCFPHDSKELFYLSFQPFPKGTMRFFKDGRNKFKVRVRITFPGSSLQMVAGEEERETGGIFELYRFSLPKITFNVTVFLKSENEGCQTSNTVQCCLTDDLSTLYKDGWLSDITVQVEEKEFAAHKVMLVARSPVFRTMFENNTKESISNRVVIKGFSPNTVANMLKFIYTKEVDDLKTNTEELLTIAHKYGLDSLKEMCESEMSKNLKVENVVDSLLLAVLLNASDLKYHALEFIKANLEVILQSEDWKKMTSDLLTDLFAIL